MAKNTSTVAELNKQLKAQTKVVERELNALKKIIAKLYPAGMRVGVTVKSGQKTPTSATVMRVEIRTNNAATMTVVPEIVVTLDTAKPNSRLAVRSVALSDVAKV